MPNLELKHPWVKVYSQMRNGITDTTYAISDNTETNYRFETYKAIFRRNGDFVVKDWNMYKCDKCSHDKHLILDYLKNNPEKKIKFKIITTNGKTYCVRF